MTPQQLIELPFAGMAKRVLKERGLWRFTMTDDERIEWLADNVKHMKRHPGGMEWGFVIEWGDYNPALFRHDIDVASS